jgi:hypothetical protein
VKDDSSKQAEYQRGRKTECPVEVAHLRLLGEPNLGLDVTFVNEATSDDRVEDLLNAGVAVLVDILGIQSEIRSDLDANAGSLYSGKAEGCDQFKILPEEGSIPLANLCLWIALLRGRVDSRASQGQSNV